MTPSGPVPILLAERVPAAGPDAAVIAARRDEADRIAPEARLCLVGISGHGGVPAGAALLRRGVPTGARAGAGMKADAPDDDHRHDKCHFNSRGTARTVDRALADLVAKTVLPPQEGDRT